MSSLEIAGLCGKRHDNVLRDIRKMADDLGLFLKFEEKGATGGRPLTVANLPKRETLTLVSGYSTEMRGSPQIGGIAHPRLGVSSPTGADRTLAVG